MKKKGFTLIELLAVIVILAIIAVIATPLVLNTIDDAKKGAANSSALNYIDCVENYIVLSNMDQSKIRLEKGIIYQLSSEPYEDVDDSDSNGIIINNLVSLKGDIPESGYLILSDDNKISKAEMIINGYIIECGSDKCDVIGTADPNASRLQFNITVASAGESADIEFKYKNLTDIKYKIGENGSYISYDGKFTLTSTEVVENNAKNDDETVTIFVTAKDKDQNDKEYQTVISGLDFDVPTAPVININGGNLKLTSTGVFNTTITYADRDDIDNYYSLDDGVTWNTYTGGFTVTSGTIQAKSVKTSSGLTVMSSADASAVASNALPAKAYDGNTSSYVTSSDFNSQVQTDLGQGYIYIDSSIYNKTLNFTCYRESVSYYTDAYAEVYNASGTKLTTINCRWGKTETKTYTIPSTASYIRFVVGASAKLYEVWVS